jgi:His-Xaa-Ser system radical SAM maturase HxsB
MTLRSPPLPVQSVSLQRLRLDALVPFQRRRVDGRWLLTTDFGDHAFVEDDELTRVLEGRVTPDEELHVRLAERHFWIDGLDRDLLTERVRRKQRFLAFGPNLHILVVTLRCNHTCQYCHASRARMDAVETDMSIEIAERSVDFAFETTSPSLTIEFQGGEPLVNWPVVEHVIEYARQKNAIAGKSLMFALVTNLSLMDEEKLAWLLDRQVQICTSLDGPAFLHDGVRVWKEGASHETAVRWIRRINEAYGQRGLDPTLYRVEALPTVTRLSLPHAKALIDEYVAVGCRGIFLRHLDPFGFASVARERLGYDMDAFLAFYREAFEAVVDLNRQGVDFVERTAAVFLGKILGHDEPNFLDIRSPCGAGIGQVAYNHDGRLFTCDEGRMVDRKGDATFQIGVVGQDRYRDVVSGAVVRAMSLASTLEGQPGCVTCAYKPWCGVCPVHNYGEQGSLHGRMADSTWCKKHMGIMDFLMTRIRRADPFERELFQRWASPREQPHYVQPRGPF